MLCCILSGKEIYAYAKTYGSLELNYQRMKAKDIQTYSFGQKLQLNLIDNLWVKNRVLVSIYLLRNQYSEQERADFRPRLSVDLSGYKYRAYYSLTPYKIYGASGYATNYRVVQTNFSVSPAKWPQLGFSYRHSHAFDNLKIRQSDYLSRYWALSSNWQYKSLSLKGNYNRQEQMNKLTAVKEYVLSAVTGGGRLYFSLPLRISTSWDYDFSFTQRESKKMPSLEIPSHSFSTTWSGRPWRSLSWSINYQGKLVKTKQNGVISKTETHSLYGGLGMSLTEKCEISLNRGSALSKTEGEESSTDYLSVLATLKGLQVIKNMDATTSFRRTYYIHADVGKYALNLFYLSSHMRIYPEIEAWADLSINHNDGPQATGRPYQVVKNVNLATRPKENLKIDFNYQTTFGGDKITFIYSEIENYRLDFTYWGKGNFSLHAGYQASLYKERKTPNSYSFSGEVSYPYRNLFSSTIVYIRRWTRDPQTGGSYSSDNLSSQFNFSLARRTRLTFTYYVTDLRRATSTSVLGVILNQQF
jgi:uncharacterized protein YutD